jgi:hypothetical protein
MRGGILEIQKHAVDPERIGENYDPLPWKMLTYGAQQDREWEASPFGRGPCARSCSNEQCAHSES